MQSNQKIIVIVDNGSLRSHSVLFCRTLARNLERRLRIPVLATSLDHSHRIPESQLRGIPARLFEPTLFELARNSPKTRIVIVPFMLIAGGAIHSKVLASVDAVRSQHPYVSLTLTETMHAPTDTPEDGITGLLADNVKKRLNDHPNTRPHIVVVDHGSPFPASAAARDHIASQLLAALGARVLAVTACSMERRPGPEYAFNDPLLEVALEHLAEHSSAPVWLARLFLQPGKHSGRHGDIDTICNLVRMRHPDWVLEDLPKVFCQKSLTKLVLLRLEQTGELHFQQMTSSSKQKPPS
jgi:sirohydrochlorin ferrochelatase